VFRNGKGYEVIDFGRTSRSTCYYYWDYEVLVDEPDNVEEPTPDWDPNGPIAKPNALILSVTCAGGDTGNGDGDGDGDGDGGGSGGTGPDDPETTNDLDDLRNSLLTNTPFGLSSSASESIKLEGLKASYQQDPAQHYREINKTLPKQLKDDGNILRELVEITQYAKAYTEGSLPNDINDGDLDATDLIDFDNLPNAFNEDSSKPGRFELNSQEGIKIVIQKVNLGHISEIYFNKDQRSLEIWHYNEIKSTPIIKITFPADWQDYYEKLYDFIY
jgi:hypothetical protein